MKRFWREVAVDEGAVLLDGRPVRTPARAPLVVPSAPLAQAIADEWRAVEGEVEPRAMPMTGLANAAIDHVAPDPAAFALTLAGYAETDVLCYRAEHPPQLAARQADAWDSLLAWARHRYDIAFVIAPGIVHRAQPAETIERLRRATLTLGPFQLAALSPLVTIGGSLVTALMLAEGAIEADAAFNATHLDELWQAELWGEEWMATEARAARRADFVVAARFLRLL